MTNEEVQKRILYAMDLKAIEDDFKDIDGRNASVLLLEASPIKFRIRISNPLEEFIVEVKVT